MKNHLHVNQMCKGRCHAGLQELPFRGCHEEREGAWKAEVHIQRLYVLLYSLTKRAYGMFGRIFRQDRSLVRRWIREAGLRMAEPGVIGQIEESEFDEMRHFMESKRQVWVHQGS